MIERMEALEQSLRKLVDDFRDTAKHFDEEASKIHAEAVEIVRLNNGKDS